MRSFLFLLFFLLSTITQALSLKEDAPKRYVVQEGDTLWSIACRYLENPWEWKALWQANPNIHNPDHLYPGETLILDYYQNTPCIRVLPNGTVKLTPNIRSIPAPIPIPAIPLDIIYPFLNESLVLDEDVLRTAPYIIAFVGERMMGGQGDPVYVKGLHPSCDIPNGENLAYAVFRPSPNYIDPVTKECLGYKATLISHAELIKGGDPATLLLTAINSGVKIEDKVLINNSPDFDLSFLPSAPSCPVPGVIIEMLGGLPVGSSQGAVGSVIVINEGQNRNLKPGDVLGIYAALRTIEDPRDSLTWITLPRERVGEAMVFKSFSKTSFALIVRSTKAVYVKDLVDNP